VLQPSTRKLPVQILHLFCESVLQLVRSGCTARELAGREERLVALERQHRRVR
jgi:hypothetical protein